MAVLLCAIVLVPLALAHTASAQSTGVQLSWFKDTGGFLGWIGVNLIKIAGMFTWFGGVILNTSLNTSILEMSTIVSNTSAIGIAWGTLRDLANIVFIFLLLAIGIGTMLRISSYGAKNLLAQVLIVAVLINFSLFFTKLIIDVPNRLAVEFYKGMQISTCDGGAKKSALDTKCGDAGLSDRFMNALKIQTLFDTKDIQAKYGTAGVIDALSGGRIFLIGVFGSIFLLIAGFIFFAAGVLLAIRFAMLILLMVLSPLAFIFMVIPYTQKYAGEWWGKLFSNAFFAPAYLLLTWISLKIIEDKNFFSVEKSDSSGNFAAAFTHGGDSLAIVFNFMVVSVFMVASLVVANKMGAYGADGMMKMGQNLRKWGQGMLGAGAGAMTFGVAGWAGRKLAGGWGAKAADSAELQRRAAAGDRGAKTKLAMANFLARSSFDVRASTIGGALTGGVLGKAGGKGGFEQNQKDKDKRLKEQAKAYGKATTAELIQKQDAEREQAELVRKQKNLEIAQKNEIAMEEAQWNKDIAADEQTLKETEDKLSQLAELEKKAAGNLQALDNKHPKQRDPVQEAEYIKEKERIFEENAAEQRRTLGGDGTALRANKIKAESALRATRDRVTQSRENIKSRYAAENKIIAEENAHNERQIKQAKKAQEDRASSFVNKRNPRDRAHLREALKKKSAPDRIKEIVDELKEEGTKKPTEEKSPTPKEGGTS